MGPTLTVVEPGALEVWRLLLLSLLTSVPLRGGAYSTRVVDPCGYATVDWAVAD